jgi:hypothetical protein
LVLVPNDILAFDGLAEIRAAFMSETASDDIIDMTKLGLRPREMQVLSATIHAWSLVGNGNYLCGTGQNHAAERLIKRGFLTKVEVDATFSPPDWIVVVITPENVEALREAQAAA